MAKDDVSPQDIFRLTKTGDPADKAIVAKYCVQDCNLVHHLMNKMDVLTGYSEMATICSVPINFLIMRGQGIKLISFLSKISGKNDTLIPDLDKRRGDEGYEGAIVLPPKCGIYLDDPVACVDYSSLYPSSMISENLSHDSKVWTKEYDLGGNLVKEAGDPEYDNLPGYKYVDVTFDTYRYIPNERGKPKKTKVGYKICRFAQFPDGKKALLPAILEELLASRKWTRKFEFFKTLKFADGTSISGLVSGNKINLVEPDNTIHVIEPASIVSMLNGSIVIKDENKNNTRINGTFSGNKICVLDKNKVKHMIDPAQIVSVEDTYDDFNKNIFDKRQLSYKLTANSMYGQCGAKTSDFYEPDVAAATTAVGRMLLTYGKRVIEEIYSDNVCETSMGPVRTNAEYVYGDTDSVFLKFNLKEMDGTPIKGKKALALTIELGKQVGGMASKFLKPPHDWEY
jgi:DNA polymerase elongation subunit (family B)